MASVSHGGRILGAEIVEVDRNRHEIQPVEFGGRNVVAARAAALFDDLLERAAYLGAEPAGDALAATRHLHQIGQHVACRQQDVEIFRRRRQAAIAQTVENGLEHMSKSDKLLEAEDAGPALDGMDSAEHGIDRLVIALARPNVGETDFDLLHRFVAFVEECLLQIVQACHVVEPCSSA